MTGVLRRARVLVAVALVAMAYGCASSPIGEAETLEQRAYAAYGSFVIAEENVEEVTRDVSPLSDAQRLSLVRAVQAAQPVVDSTMATLEQYQSARADFQAGRAERGTLDAVAERLGGWVEQAEMVVGRLLAAVRSR